MIDLQKFRRDLHMHPETGFDLVRTPERIAATLEAAGLEVVQGIGKSGLVATIRRNDDGPAIGLRADMDALPITEANGFDHRSTVPGKFHGCGHDGHSTMLVGAALALAEDSDLGRTVHFIFQPNEENGLGAAAMIADGLFERFPMGMIFGLHNLPGMEVGQFATQPGAFCAFEDNFEIVIEGRGGHASAPDLSIDPIVIGSTIVLQLQTIVARSLPPREHAVVSVTEFITDGARNILPSVVRIKGDCRGFSPDVSKTIEARMRGIAEGVCQAQNATCRVTYSTSFQPLANDPAATKVAASAALKVGSVDAAYGTVGFSEDFAEFLKHCPGAFVMMGNGVSEPHSAPLHNPHYDFNDDAIQTGVEFWCQLAKSPAM